MYAWKCTSIMLIVNDTTPPMSTVHSLLIWCSNTLFILQQQNNQKSLNILLKILLSFLFSLYIRMSLHLMLESGTIVTISDNLVENSFKLVFYFVSKVSCATRDAKYYWLTIRKRIEKKERARWVLKWIYLKTKKWFQYRWKIRETIIYLKIKELSSYLDCLNDLKCVPCFRQRHVNLRYSFRFQMNQRITQNRHKCRQIFIFIE